ncbi:MAG: alpha-hydroxy acid oxidase [Burkholderiales bacterium]
MPDANDFQTLHEVVKAARANVPDGPWDYLVGAAETETTVLRNRLAIDSLALRPRVLNNVRDIDCTSTFLGQRMRLPVFVAPMGSVQMLDPSAGLGLAKGAEQFGVTSFLSSTAAPGLEAVAAGSKGPKIFQLYVRGDLAWVEDYVRRAMAGGFHAFCITVDTALYGRRERDVIKRFVPTARRAMTGADFQAGISWDLVRWFKTKFSIPLILKGIATAEDAVMAVEHGVEVVYVSNHGGRQLDQGVGSLDVLPEVLEAVRGRADVIVDGGFMRGTDVLKGIAMGAKAVGLGRVCGFGLAAGGDAGVRRVLELMEVEIRTAMGLLGVTRVDQLKRAHVRAAPVIRMPHILKSAFPHLDLPEGQY